MNHKLRPFVLSGVFSLIALAGCSTIEDLFEREKDISAADLPAAVTAAMGETAPDLEIKEVEIKTEDGLTIYEIEGTSGGQHHELRITADGNVLADRTGE